MLQVERPISPTADRAESYVWYASYGSNLLRTRFDCYLNGTQIPGQHYGCSGARNRAEPQAVASLDVPHDLFFARQSPRWGGGIAFLDPSVRAGASARLRLYKITLGQFNDVFAQENKLPVPLPEKACITSACLGGLSATSGISVTDRPYGYLKHLGDKQGCPVLTFTCSPHERGLALEGTPPWHFNFPSPAYYDVIKAGLTESGMGEAAAQRYMHASLALPCAIPARRPSWDMGNSPRSQGLAMSM